VLYIGFDVFLASRCGINGSTGEMDSAARQPMIMHTSNHDRICMLVIMAIY
jgi:hypothetical protein